MIVTGFSFDSSGDARLVDQDWFGSKRGFYTKGL